MLHILSYGLLLKTCPFLQELASHKLEDASSLVHQELSYQQRAGRQQWCVDKQVNKISMWNILMVYFRKRLDFILFWYFCIFFLVCSPCLESVPLLSNTPSNHSPKKVRIARSLGSSRRYFQQFKIFSSLLLDSITSVSSSIICIIIYCIFQWNWSFFILVPLCIVTSAREIMVCLTSKITQTF